MSGEVTKEELVRLSTLAVLARHEAKAQEARSDRFRDDAARYYDIREWLRLCEDTPEGHAEFYRECSAVIFPDTT